MADHARALLLGAGHEAGRVDEDDERQAEAVQRSTKRAPFSAAAASITPPSQRGWLAIDADRAAVDPREPVTMFRAQRASSSSSAPPSTMRRDDVAHVVDAARLVRAPARRGRAGAARAAALRARSPRCAEAGSESRSRAQRDRLGVVGGGELADAVVRVHAGAAELVHRHVLAQRLAHDLRARSGTCARSSVMTTKSVSAGE